MVPSANPRHSMGDQGRHLLGLLWLAGTSRAPYVKVIAGSLPGCGEGPNPPARVANAVVGLRSFARPVIVFLSAIARPKP